MGKAADKYRILSIDGGGIKAVIPAIILDRLTRELGDWTDKFDLIAGTSVGGLIALAIASGMPSKDIREFLETKGELIFADSLLDDIRDLSQLLGAQYDNKYLERSIVRMVGGYDITLGDLEKTVLIPSFTLDNEDKDQSKRRWKPKLFHNLPTSDSDADEFAWKVGLYTSAAPTYFPAVDGYIDGGIYANNPCMCALAQTQDLRLEKRPALDDVVMLSLSCGSAPSYIERKPRLDWGITQWAKPLLDILFDGVNDVATYQSQMILNDRFMRINPTFKTPGSLGPDYVKRLPEMVMLAESYDLTDTLAWINKNWFDKPRV